MPTRLYRPGLLLILLPVSAPYPLQGKACLAFPGSAGGEYSSQAAGVAARKWWLLLQREVTSPERLWQAIEKEDVGAVGPAALLRDAFASAHQAHVVHHELSQNFCRCL